MHSPLSSCDSVCRNMAVRTDTALEVKPELYNKGATHWEIWIIWFGMGWDAVSRSGLGREEVRRLI